METLEQIKARIEAAVPGARVDIIPNGSPANQPSLLLGSRARAGGGAISARRSRRCALDYASNVTGVDWPEKTIKEKIKVKKVVDGVEKEVEEVRERKTPAYLEAVYHLYSMAPQTRPAHPAPAHGEPDRPASRCPSLTPVWRSCEFQEREIFDLYGIAFRGPSRFAPHFDVAGIQRSSDAQGLRRAGRLRIRTDSARCTCWTARASIIRKGRRHDRHLQSA